MRRAPYFTELGAAAGAAASVLVLLLTWIAYLMGEPTSGRALGAQAAAFLLSMVVGLPFSILFAPLAQNLTGALAWLAITGMPVLNGALIGAIVDGIRVAARAVSGRRAPP